MTHYDVDNRWPETTSAQRSEALEMPVMGSPRREIAVVLGLSEKGLSSWVVRKNIPEEIHGPNHAANPPKDTDGRREGSGGGGVRELQGRWPGLLGSADGLQSPHRPPKALCGSCEKDTQQGTLATGVARDCGDVGSVAGWPSAGNGMACSRAKARLNWVSQGQRRGDAK